MSELMDKRRLSQLEILISARKGQFYKTMNSPCGAHILVEGKDCINYISSNYLGFSIHPKVIEAIKNELVTYGGGMTGSPVMCGITETYKALCKKLAEIYAKEDAIIFSTGYQGILGTIQCTIGIGDVALFDKFAHRSLIDGAILSGAGRFFWKHNDLDSLEEFLIKCKDNYKRKLIIVDSVYSMDGDIADLPGIIKLKEKYDALLLADEAHSLGVIGENGHGICDHFNISGDTIDVVCGALSKTGAAIGGFVASSKDYIQYLKQSATSYLFSTALPPHLCAGILKTLNLITEEPEWLERLWKNINYFNAAIKSLGFNIGNTCSAIIPIYIRDWRKTVEFAQDCFDDGIIVAPIRHPVVAEGEERIRIGMSSLHSQDDLDRTIEVFGRIGKKIGVI
jgi:glycine C-acetyltransferase